MKLLWWLGMVLKWNAGICSQDKPFRKIMSRN
jgi:hypothetical protein